MSNDDLDGWVSQLMQCKPLGEPEVKKLCDKVSWMGLGLATALAGERVESEGVGLWLLQLCRVPRCMLAQGTGLVRL